MTKYRANMKVFGMAVGDTVVSYDPEQSPYFEALVLKGVMSIVDEEVSDGGQGLAPDSAPDSADIGLGEGVDSGGSGGSERGSTQLASRHRTTA